MYRLVYLSRPKPWVDENEVTSIVETSQGRNAERGITGFLCMRDGYFLQYLEGERDAVQELYGRIESDSRHEMLKMVELDDRQPRRFHDWTMRYLDSHYAGQLSLEDMLEGVVREFGRGTVEEARLRNMAERLLGILGELVH